MRRSVPLRNVHRKLRVHNFSDSIEHSIRSEILLKLVIEFNPCSSYPYAIRFIAVPRQISYAFQLLACLLLSFRFDDCILILISFSDQLMDVAPLRAVEMQQQSMHSLHSHANVKMKSFQFRSISFEQYIRIQHSN